MSTSFVFYDITLFEEYSPSPIPLFIYFFSSALSLETSPWELATTKPRQIPPHPFRFQRGWFDVSLWLESSYAFLTGIPYTSYRVPLRISLQRYMWPCPPQSTSLVMLIWLPSQGFIWFLHWIATIFISLATNKESVGDDILYHINTRFSSKFFSPILRFSINRWFLL